MDHVDIEYLAGERRLTSGRNIDKSFRRRNIRGLKYMASRSVQTILNSIDQYQRLVGLIYNKYRGCVKILDRTLPDQIVNSARKFNYIRNLVSFIIPLMSQLLNNY